jgi:hypothetical protein
LNMVQDVTEKVIHQMLTDIELNSASEGS